MFDQGVKRLGQRVGFPSARELAGRIAQSLVLRPESLFADAVLDEAQQRPRLLQILTGCVDRHSGVRREAARELVERVVEALGRDAPDLEREPVWSLEPVAHRVGEA